MKRIHPNVRRPAAVAALTVGLMIVGCRTPTGGVANPFLAPNRVPPPATRALLPGQAQPYYPGDPLPAMQSQTAPPANASLIASGEARQIPPADTNLAWGASSRAAGTAENAPQLASLASATEPSVAIPTDGESLRFASPAEPVPFTPTAPAAMPNSAAPSQFAEARSDSRVLQASHTTPAATVPPPMTAAASNLAAAEPATFSPWRPPEIAQPAPANGPAVRAPLALPPPPSTSPMAIAPQSAFAAPQRMDVRVRAVPSPPPEPADSSMPRIRLPNHIASDPTTSPDGFRPRSSMR